MRYTITSAKYADQDNKSMVIMTVERAAVAVSEADHPDLWAQIMGSGISVSEYEEV